MAALPSVSGEQAVRVFQKAGWIKDRQRGSHVILFKPGHASSLSVPQHREVAPGIPQCLFLSLGAGEMLTRASFGGRDHADVV